MDILEEKSKVKDIPEIETILKEIDKDNHEHENTH